jgi:tetratricopeptide (TPR) repeat protein
VDLRRRNFLIHSCQSVSAALLRSRLGGLVFPALRSTDSSIEGGADVQFHLHPHYRTPRPIDRLLLNTQAGLDEFITEKYADQLATMFSKWTASMLRSPRSTEAIEKVLASSFSAASLEPLDAKVVRSHAGLEVHQNRFSNQPTVGKDAFVKELQSVLSPFEKILTAGIEILSIEASPSESASGTPARLSTRVRYELVGSGRDFYREQRVGYWNLEWEANSSGGFELSTWRALEETWSRASEAVFSDITADAFGGVSSYGSQLLRGADYWRTVLDGASGIDIYGHNGVSVGDIDNDGSDDLYICQGAGLPNRLYRNRGDGTFEDVTDKAGVGVLENTACALFVDIDNDGRQDLIVVRTNGPLLFLNEGGGRFRQKPDAFRFASAPAGTFTGAAVADYDRDGWLDIYFCLYVYYQGTDQYKYPTPYYDAENGPPNFMLRNNRDGTFRDVTAESGLNQNNTRYSFCCGWNDYNRDGWPDLYVVNDFGRKNLYRNNGDGTFTDVAAQAGAEDPGAGMSVCWLDYDNDGADDLYVADMWTAAGRRVAMQDIFQKDAPEKARALYRKHAMGNSLLRNAGDGAFQDPGPAAGVGMGRWSWSSDSWDFDHDGFPDLYVVNGMVSGASHDDLNSFFWRQVVAKSPASAKPSQDYEQGWSAINELIRADGTWSGYERNVFYANNRDGTFSDISGVTGLDFLEDGRSFALADFDHDGRLEALVKNRSAPQVRLVKNVSKDLGPSIAFRLEGTKSNRDAVGAAVTVESDSGRQTSTVRAGSGFLSQHSKDVLFGLGNAKGKVRASVRWPSGLVQELHDLPINHRIWVKEGATRSRWEPFKTPAPFVHTPVVSVSESESLPTVVETWLLAPIAAPDFSLPDLNEAITTLAAFRGKRVLLHLWASGSQDHLDGLLTLNRRLAAWATDGLQLVTVNLDDPSSPERLRVLASKHQLALPVLRGSQDIAAVYNILYRYLYDRHRDLSLPTSFLIDESGHIVKVYQGPLNLEHVEQDVRQIPHSPEQRLAKALPFAGVTSVSEFQRNYLSYGSVLFQRGYLDQAEASFQHALQDDPSSAEAWYGLGSVYLQQQRAPQARESFERVTKLSGTYPDTLPNAWNNLGLLATREGRTAEAIPYFQEALRVSPDHLIALVNLGNAYRQQKDWESARKTLEHAVEVGPADPEANYSLGMVCAQLADTDRAYTYLRRALTLRPAYPEALNNLGILYLRTRRREEAVRSFEECIRVAPSFDQSYLNLARVYALEEQPGKARAVLLDLLKQHPDHVLAQKALQELPH